MNPTAEALDFVQAGRATVRFHGRRMIDYQRIDAHSYGVAQLVRFIVGFDAPHTRMAPLLMAALDHDLAEWIAGDIPAPTKRELGTEWRREFNEYEDRLTAGHGLYHALSPEDQRVLKLADAAEGCLHCIEERLLGNQTIPAVFYEFWKYCTDEQSLWLPGWAPGGNALDTFHEPGEEVLSRYISRAWTRANGGQW